MTFLRDWKRHSGLSGRGEGSNSSSDRLKADIQLLGWGTAPHSWPGSAPASEVYPQSGVSQQRGWMLPRKTNLPAQPCITHVLKSFICVLSLAWGELKARGTVIGARPEEGVLVILCHSGQKPRQKQLNRGKEYLDLWFQRVSVHHDGSVRLWSQEGVVGQEAEAQQKAGRQNLERHLPYNPLPSEQIPLSWGRARVVLGEK